MKHIVPILTYLSPSDIRRICNVDKLRAFLNPIPTIERSRIQEIKSWPYKGSYKTFPKFENQPYITSYVEFSEDFSKATGNSINGEFQIKAPKGYLFGIDENGPKMYKTSSPKKDIHLSSSNVYLGGLILRKFLLDNAKIRWDNLQRQRASKKEINRYLNNTVILLEDARRAGNCAAGIVMFAKRNHIDLRTGILAKRIMNDNFLKKEKIVENRIKSAFNCAVERETLIMI